LIQRGKASLLREYLIKLRIQLGLLFGCGRLLVDLQLGIKIPDLGSFGFKRRPLFVVETYKFVDGALGVNPFDPSAEQSRL